MDQKNISKSLIKIEEGSNIIPELIKIEMEEDGCLVKSDGPYCPDIHTQFPYKGFYLENNQHNDSLGLENFYNENLKICITPADARADVNSSKTLSVWTELATQLRGCSESLGQRPRRSVIPHRCPDCPYTAKRKYHIIVHRRIHTGEKPYKCPECSYCSSQKSNLDTHLMTHTGKKPYKCSECPYRSRRKSYLTIHHRRHTGEKPYKCSECNFISGGKSRLVRHKKIHRGKFDIKASVAQNIKHTVLKSKRQVSTPTSTSKHQLVSEGPLFVKPLNLVKPLTLVDPPTFVNPFISKSSVLPTSYPSLFSYLPALSTMTQLQLLLSSHLVRQPSHLPPLSHLPTLQHFPLPPTMDFISPVNTVNIEHKRLILEALITIDCCWKFCFGLCHLHRYYDYRI